MKNHHATTEQLYNIKLGDQIGNYRIIRKIGSGGMATIYEARHEQHGARCALKIMHNNINSEEMATRFQREFNALSEIMHPNVLKVTENGIHKGRPYFAMEFLDGRVLKDEIEYLKNLPPTQRYEQVEQILIQLAQALFHIHKLGWIHRDVTPSNIMVLKDKGIKLMDFGVIKIPGQELTMAGEVIGTVAYISPEQIRGGHIDARADLYSLGGVLYLMLSGHRPFQSKTAAGFLERHLNKRPKPLKHYAPMIPRKIEDACLRLLEKEPDKRFASAQHLLFFLDAPFTPSNDGSIFVGRAQTISIIQEHLAGLHENQGGVLLIEGGPGSGVTSLLKKIQSLSKNQDLISSFNQGRTYKKSAYQGLRSLIELLPESLQHLIYSEDKIQKWVVFSKIRDAIVELGKSIIILDNLHVSDAGTVELITYLIRNTLSERQVPIFFLLGVNPSHNTSEIDDILSGNKTGVSPTQITLPPIDLSATEEWLLHYCKYDERVPYLSKRLQHESDGNPALIKEMIKGLFDKNILLPEKALIQIPIENLQQTALPLPSSVRESYQQRMTKLSKEAHELALLIAISRCELSSSTLNDAIQYMSAHVGIQINQQSAIEELIHFGFVECFGDDPVFYEIQNGWLRDLLIESSNAEGLQMRHRAIGNAMEAAFQFQVMSVVEHLAHHFECGECYGKAYPYLMQSAKSLKNRTMMKEAMRYLERALSIEPMAREHIPIRKANSLLSELLLARASIAFVLGNWELAMEQIRAAEQHALRLGNEELLCRIISERSHQIRERLSLDEREKCCNQALKLSLKLGYPKLQIMPHYEYGAISWERGEVLQARNHFLETMQLARTQNDTNGQILGHNGMGVLAMCHGQSAEARKNFEEAVKIGKADGHVESLVNVRTNLAELHHCMGNFKRGFELVNQGITECREVGYRNGLGVYLRYRVMLLGDLGKFVEADETANIAINILRDLDNKQEEFAAVVNLLRSVIPTGHLPRITELIETALLLAEEYDVEGYYPIIQIWKANLLFACGNYSGARALLTAIEESAPQDWKHQRARFSLNLARAWLLLDEHPRARLAAEEALDISDNSGYRFYAMRARQILSKCSEDEDKAKRHARIALALLRSLSANIGEEYRKSFLARNEMFK